MNTWKTDIAVLCIFFARPKQFKQCFEAVRKARPKTLLLWQDGPREGRPDDIEKIKECRKIAENIDWDCEIYKNYHDKNMGCDPSTFYSHKWAFSIVDKCIILEDDLVPCESFFPFCKEMLDKYENDERIDRICGTNLLGEYNIPNDYFFMSGGNSWGWATWRRVAEKWEEKYEFINDEYVLKRLELINPFVDEGQKWWINRCINHQKEKIPYWEFIIGAEVMLQSRLCIYPSKNMISNVGISENSTHAPSDINKLPKSIKQYFNTKTYDISLPVRDPKYIFDDRLFPKLVTKKYKISIFSRILNKFLR